MTLRRRARWVRFDVQVGNNRGRLGGAACDWNLPQRGNLRRQRRERSSAMASRAAEQGDDAAQRVYADCLAIGIGVAKDEAKILNTRWFLPRARL